ncbi:TIGR03668 family PPOX class F420-dependent oxidoreductase [soil metagenome]
MARLATMNPDGAADLVHVTFALLDDDRVVTAVDHKPKRTTRLQRLANLQRDPRATLLVDHYDERWDRLWWVRMRARAEILALDGPDARAHAGAVDALVDRYDHYREVRPTGPVIRLTVDEWLGWAADPGSITAPSSR